MKSWQVLRNNRGYLALAFGLFLLGAVLGIVFAHQLLAVTDEALKHLKDLAEQAQTKDSPVYMSTLIFFNNLRAAVAMLLMGIAFSIVTMITLVFNGLMIGTVFEYTGQTVSMWKMVVFGILPHGIFELSAIFIMGAFGIKLGRVLLWPLPDKSRWQSFKFVWREVFSISWLVLALLLVAAAVEGMVTPLVMNQFVR